ncbi:MAG: hypothetical protein LGL72_18130 [Acidibrevibacterium sp.]|uniref:hypothetical protein n=1 Tax=Acidibrevibacterium fodinaquatile TaxID=1969806 RepID=UPI0023A8046C|nr:hypothetical protein [Acidibrevibacterium fodinaquatile]MCA7121265.1 hypothetical protein [Acidibrevibacterium fodinaquatile]
MSLYDPSGARKYLTRSERDAFLAAAEHADRQVRTLGMTSANTRPAAAKDAASVSGPGHA